MAARDAPRLPEGQPHAPPGGARRAARPATPPGRLRRRGLAGVLYQFLGLRPEPRAPRPEGPAALRHVLAARDAVLPVHRALPPGGVHARIRRTHLRDLTLRAARRREGGRGRRCAFCREPRARARRRSGRIAPDPRLIADTAYPGGPDMTARTKKKPALAEQEPLFAPFAYEPQLDWIELAALPPDDDLPGDVTPAFRDHVAENGVLY